MTNHGHHSPATFDQNPLCDTSSNKGHFFLVMPNLANACCSICNSHQSLFNFLNAYSMSVTANTTYTSSFSKKPGAPNQVFKFDNFLDRLIGGIKANTISAIGTINPGSLCTQYLNAPQINFNLAGEPIALLETCPTKWVSSV
jgi:hypothetical protein